MATLVVVEDLAAPAVLHRGGHAMLIVHMLHGLARLGHRVVFVEFLDHEPAPEAVRWFEAVMREHWSPDACALFAPGERPVAGLDARAVEAVAAKADAVITVAAHYRREPWPLVGGVRPRILFENDPGYTHLWAADGDPLDIFGEHDVYFTVGANVGTDRCALPTFGIEWHALWNPVVLELWPRDPAPTDAGFSTVAGLRDYGWLEFDGALLGPKIEELRKFRRLPGLVGEELALVAELDRDDPDRSELERDGWLLLPPDRVQTPTQFRDFVRSSAGEFSVAKGGYVGTHCGWFSDRSACYLAAGRPVVLEATGFEDVLPTGEGLFAVEDVEGAAAAIEAIRSDPARHSAAAARIAAEYFDSDQLLTRMLSEAGVV